MLGLDEKASGGGTECETQTVEGAEPTPSTVYLK